MSWVYSRQPKNKIRRNGYYPIKCPTVCIIRTVPGREYVETYIKAYYLPDDTLEAWVKEHKVDIRN